MIQLITDSGVNFPKEYLDSHPEIEILHLPTVFNGEDISDMDIDTFYKIGFVSEALPKTSQISPQQYVDAFSRYKNADAILYISLASGLSGTYNSACLAKNILAEDGLPPIYIFDSETAAVKQSLLVDIAYDLIHAGENIETILAKLEEARNKIVFYAVIEDLNFLYLGGRLSKTAATAAGILGVRPIVTVEEGKVKVLQKLRGSKKTISFLLDNIHQDEVNKMFIVCGEKSKDYDTFINGLTIPYVEEKIQKTIGTYTGPKCYGYAYIKK